MLDQGYAIHRLSHTRAYKDWEYVFNCCVNKKFRLYKNYGGIGICMQSSWLRFECFYQDMGDAPEGRALTRLDLDDDFCQSNCVWGPAERLPSNRSSEGATELDGFKAYLSEWSEALKLNHGTTKSNLSIGQSLRKALGHPSTSQVNCAIEHIKKARSGD